MLIRYGRFTEEELKEIADLAAKDLKAANRKAMAAPDPDPSTVKDYVLPEPYQPQKYKEGVQNEEGEKETLVTAINKTLKAEFRHNPDTFIWGQDVANKERVAYSTSRKACSKNSVSSESSTPLSPRIIS